MMWGEILTELIVNVRALAFQTIQKSLKTEPLSGQLALLDLSLCA
jgi:hypothetical protein